MFRVRTAVNDDRWTLQDEQYPYNVTLRRVHATTVAVEEQRVLHILSVWL